MDIDKPHDSFFKNVFGSIENTTCFLKNFLPEQLSSKIDYDSVRIEDTQKTDAGFKRHVLDLAVECRLAGTESKFYFVFEHKSSFDKHTLLQILRYCTVTWENNLAGNEPLIPIIPIVFYHGRQKLVLPERFADYFAVADADVRSYLLDFGYVLFDAARYSDDDIEQRSGANVYFMAALQALKHIFGRTEDLTVVFRHFGQLDKDRFLYIMKYISTAHVIDDRKSKEILEIAGGTTMPTLAQIWTEEGRQEGLQKGMQKGMQQGMILGEQEMLLDALEAKFGQVPEHIVKKIQAVSDRGRLKFLHRLVFSVQSIVEFEQKTHNSE